MCDDVWCGSWSVWASRKNVLQMLQSKLLSVCVLPFNSQSSSSHALFTALTARQNQSDLIRTNQNWSENTEADFFLYGSDDQSALSDNTFSVDPDWKNWSYLLVTLVQTHSRKLVCARTVKSDHDKIFHLLLPAQLLSHQTNCSGNIKSSDGVKYLGTVWQS